MKFARILSRPRVANAVVLSVVSASLVFAAVRADGYHATNVDLNDGAVWLFRDDAGWISKANSQTAEIESAFKVPGATLVQDGDDVLAMSAQGLQRLDVKDGKATNAVPMPAGMQVGASARTGYLFNPGTGDLWVAPAASLVGWDESIEPAVTVSPASQVVISVSGSVIVLDPATDTVSMLHVDEQGGAVLDPNRPFGHDVPETDAWSLTVVGETAVVLEGSDLLVAGKPSIDLSSLGGPLALQQVGPGGDKVAVASDDRLVRVGFDGKVEELSAKGTGFPARPSVTTRCVSAAWSGGSPWYVQRCGGTAYEGPIPNLPSGAPLEFRVNGRALALSGPGTIHFIVRDGQLWPITNWDQADPDRKKQDDNQEQQTVEQDDQLERTCEEQPVAPTGPADALEFGARVGQTVVLDVLSYFNDANCDPLAITSVTPRGVPQEQVSIINFGQALQLRTNGTPGEVTIEFTVDDGDSTSAVSGTAVITVTAESSHEPRLKADRQARTTVQVGKTVSYNVLIDWIDDDGDVLVLESTFVGEGQGRVISSADGLVTYTAENTTPGQKTVDYSLTDGANVVTGTLEIVVQPEGTQMRPVARDDYAAGQVGQPIKVFPLLNDTDANNDVLIATPILDGVSPALQVDASGSDRSFVFTATEAGSYVMRYRVADTSDKVATAAIRLEVLPVGDANRPPVAVRDAVVVREGRAANVDVLVNDTDPDGDLLAVVDARVTPDLEATDAVRVVVIERRYVRVEVFRDPGQPIEITYLINDGRSQNVEGALTITVPDAQQNQFPIVADDRATVRVDEVVSVNVLANDRDPDGDQLLFIPSVDGSSSVQISDGDGSAWLDGSTVRYKAGSKPTGARPVVITYQVDDDPALRGLHRTTGTLLIDVRDDEANLPPVPQPLSLRVFTDSRASVRVPLSGLDANGDTAIMRADLRKQPSELGSAQVLGDTVVFEAGPTAGTGIIEYVVQDRFGLQGIGIIRVVVVEGVPFDPVPLNDKVRVRPGRDIQVNVLANDTDPNGDPLTIENELIVDDPALQAKVNADGQRVDLTIPDGTAKVTYSVKYSVNDGHGGIAPATIVVEVDPDAPLQAPLLRDDPDAQSPIDVYAATDSAGNPVKVTDINVIENDEDPDGSRNAIAIEVAPGQNVDTGDTLQGVEPLQPGWLRVVMRDEPQWVVYQATDGDYNTASAVMFVDSTANRAPVCPADPIRQVAIAGGPAITIAINDVIKDPDGDTVRMSGADITLSPADGTLTQTERNYDTFTYLANPTTTRSLVVAAVEVEDRKGEADSLTRTCFLQLTVERTNNPPVVQDTSFPVEQSEQPVPLVLTDFVTDEDDDTLQFRLPQGGDSVSQDAVTLTLSGNGSATLLADNARIGASPVFTYEVWDGQPTSQWQTGKVRVTVIPTTKAPPTVLSKEFVDVPQGQPYTYDVSAGAFNPFDTDLVYTVEKSAFEGLGSASSVGSVVTFTPAVNYFGQAVVRFTATDEVGREAIGTLTYTVIGKPLDPGQPNVSEVSSHRVVMGWAPADPQGTPITDYIVRWPGGEFRTGGAASATIAGLTNGVQVAFTVTAQNKLGEGPASVPSLSVMPDEVPQMPARPVIDPAFGNGDLTVRWEPPIVDGSPVIEYRLSISSGGTVTVGAGTLEYTWLGLTNGTPYSFAVVAVNSAGPSERSDFSDQLSPATFPSFPTGLVAADAGSAIECRAQLSWTRPADNGRPITGYEILVDGATTISTFIADPAISQSFTVGCGTHTYQVRAVNVVGPSGWSAATAPTVSPRQPSAANLVSAASNTDLAIPIAIGWPTDNGGCSVAKFQYTTGSGVWADVPGGLKASGASYTLTAQSTGAGFGNGTQYAVQVRAINCKVTVAGIGSNARNATPSGAPINSGIGISASPSGQTITWGWSTAGAYNGSPLSVSVTGAGFSTTAASSGGTNKDYGAYNSPQTLTVQVCDAVSRCTSKSLGSATGSPPGMVVRPWTGTCPEDDMAQPDHYDSGPPATCSSPGGFIATNTAVTVTCRINSGMAISGTTNWRWLRISAGGPVNWYVSDYTVTEVTDSLPVC